MSSTKNPLHRAFKVDVAAHGRFENVEPVENVNLQVINLGLSRTGTTSVSAALEILGFGPCHQGVASSPPAWQCSAQANVRPRILSAILLFEKGGYRCSRT